MSEDSFIRDLTVAQFRQLCREMMAEEKDASLLRGMAEISEYLGVSTKQLARLRERGVFRSSIAQAGRTITADPQSLRREWETYCHGSRRRS